jgi:cell wall-associated NlpC family hydrolase
MSRWLIISLLLACAGAQAMPGAPAEEDASGIFMADQRVLTRLEQVSTRLEQVGTKLEQVGSTVTDRASDLVVTSMGFLGVPYKRGGTTAESGFDCSGLVRAIYQNTIGLVLPRRANEQAAATEKIDKKDLQPGDLVFFNTMKRAFSHVGIYVGEGKFIHSPKPGAKVRVEDMGQNYWQRRFDGARRVLTQVQADPQASRQP